MEILGSVVPPFTDKKEFPKQVVPLRKFFHYLNENGAVRFNLVMHNCARDAAINDPKYKVSPSGDLTYLPKNDMGQFEKQGGWDHGNCGALLDFKMVNSSPLIKIVHRVQCPTV